MSPRRVASIPTWPVGITSPVRLPSLAEPDHPSTRPEDAKASSVLGRHPTSTPAPAEPLDAPGGGAAPSTSPGAKRSPLPSTRASSVSPDSGRPRHPTAPPAPTILWSSRVGFSPSDASASCRPRPSRLPHPRASHAPGPSLPVSSADASSRSEKSRAKGVGPSTVPGSSCRRSCTSTVTVSAPGERFVQRTGTAQDARPSTAACAALVRVAYTSCPGLDWSGSRYEKPSSARDADRAVTRRAPPPRALTSPMRSRASPKLPPAAQTSVPSGAPAFGGSSTSVPPSEPGPREAGANVRCTWATAPGQRGRLERSSDGSAPPVSGTPAKTIPTCVDVEPRMLSAENESSPRTCARARRGSGSTRLPTSVSSRGDVRSSARDSKSPASSPRTVTSSGGSDWAEAAPVHTRTESPAAAGRRFTAALRSGSRWRRDRSRWS